MTTLANVQITTRKIRGSDLSTVTDDLNPSHFPVDLSAFSGFDPGDSATNLMQMLQLLVNRKGDQGVQGPVGSPGTAATITVNSTTTLNVGTNASVTEAAGSTAQNRLLVFGIPRGNSIVDVQQTGNQVRFEIDTSPASYTSYVTLPSANFSGLSDTNFTSVATNDSLVYDTNAWVNKTPAQMRSILQVDPAGTQTSTDVSFSTSTSYNYLTLTGQEITLNQIDLASDVTGTLPLSSGGTGQTSAAAAIEALLPSYSGNQSRVLALNSNANGLAWVAATTGSSSGTVTSVAVTGSNGIAVTNGTVTTSGTIALSLNLGTGLTYNSSTQAIDNTVTNTDTLASLSSADGNFVVGAGSTFVVESGATARTSLGLGTAATTASSDYATSAQGTLADSAVQPNDAATSLNVSATDKILGRATTGAGSVEEITCTSAGRDLLDDADTAAQRQTLGLIIGTDVQAAGSYLTAETNDLSSAVTWANVPDAYITQTSVTQHEASLAITESQITDLGSYISDFTFSVTAGSGVYIYSGLGASGNNPTLYLTRGKTYTFAVNASGHPFHINTVNATGTSNQYTSGITGQGATSGNLVFTVPQNAPSKLYYNCQYHSAMNGTIHILNETSDLTQVSGTLDLANGGTNATTATAARTNLGIGTIGTLTLVNLQSHVTGTLPAGSGGTGVTALANLDVATLGSGSSTINHVLTSDGAGGMSFQAATGGGATGMDSVVAAIALG